ncbi:hypothetical protein BJ138DRAFT_1163770 [Hygrophoropsis aurantiaca]|uniref:Uncharacterized protein n=1 Tax=Hygrophoropsis aurantiaca TaxID=72124 RepID=A0ACB7ZXU9_9AGAM|nr:hypothetical protein BJ138DRAFT_1163770 [Hygrophoropsis aurantiaca]
MGTRGLKIYHYRGVYFVFDVSCVLPQEFGRYLLRYVRKGDFKSLHATLDYIIEHGTAPPVVDANEGGAKADLQEHALAGKGHDFNGDSFDGGGIPNSGVSHAHSIDADKSEDSNPQNNHDSNAHPSHSPTTDTVDDRDHADSTSDTEDDYDTYNFSPAEDAYLDKCYTYPDEYFRIEESMHTIKPPYVTSAAEYTYELDFDRNVFHFQGQPFYALDNLPSDREFLRSVVARDRFGNPAPRKRCPKEHVYAWKVAPPVVDLDEVRARIPAASVEGTELPMHTILGTNAHLSRAEATRVRVLESIVANYLHNGEIAALVHEFETFAGPAQISEPAWRMARALVNFPFMLQIFGQGYDDRDAQTEFTWVRRDIVAYVTTHLDDAASLRAAVLRIVEACMRDDEKAEKRPDMLFGVAFSVHHCIVVRVLRKPDNKISYQHTPALQFVPSFFADSPSTPGITALARLAFSVPDADLMQRALWWHLTREWFTRHSPMTYRYARFPLQLEEYTLQYRRSESSKAGVVDVACPASTTTSASPLKKSAAERLPLEIWTLTASFIPDLASLIDLGCVSRTCEQAACVILRHPHIVLGREPDAQSLCRLIHTVPHNGGWNLCFAEFDAIERGQRLVGIEMGLPVHDSDTFLEYPLYYYSDYHRNYNPAIAFSLLEFTYL